MSNVIKFPRRINAEHLDIPCEGHSCTAESSIDTHDASVTDTDEPPPSTLFIVVPQQRDASWLILGALVVVAGLLGFLIAAVEA